MQRRRQKQSRKPPTLEVEDKNHRSRNGFYWRAFQSQWRHIWHICKSPQCVYKHVPSHIKTRSVPDPEICSWHLRTKWKQPKHRKYVCPVYATDEGVLPVISKSSELRHKVLEKQEEEAYRKITEGKKVQMASDITYLLSTAVIRVRGKKYKWLKI